MKIDTLISELRSFMLKYGNIEVGLFVKYHYCEIDKIVLDTDEINQFSVTLESESVE